ncbi:MAG: hypothetical protein KME31_15095 [Tolypothrix carrinoi HA7290-LM1]|jgi:hypothetical protein|nr:hypothetical protein [Tolypothrix carrinoi HA7290-LM1]
MTARNERDRPPEADKMDIWGIGGQCCDLRMSKISKYLLSELLCINFI